MNEHDSMLFNAIWHMMGVVPIGPGQSNNDINRILSSIPSDEAQVMKRKFRKLWRSIVKKKIKSTKYTKATIMKTFGLLPEGAGSIPPTRSQKLNRKRIVLNHVYQEILLPMKKLAKNNID